MKATGPSAPNPSTRWRRRLRPSRLTSSPTPARWTKATRASTKAASRRSRHQPAARGGAGSVKPMSPPRPARLDDGARLRERLERAQGGHEDRALLGDGEGLAHRMAERVAEVERPGRLHPSRDLLLQRDPDGRDPRGLDGALDQAHGLVAEP